MENNVVYLEESIFEGFIMLALVIFAVVMICKLYYKSKIVNKEIEERNKRNDENLNRIANSLEKLSLK